MYGRRQNQKGKGDHEKWQILLKSPYKTSATSGGLLVSNIDLTKYIIISCVSNRTETGYYTNLFWAISSGTSGDYYMILCLDATGSRLLSTDVAVDVYYMEK